MVRPELAEGPGRRAEGPMDQDERRRVRRCDRRGWLPFQRPQRARGQLVDTGRDLRIEALHDLGCGKVCGRVFDRRRDRVDRMNQHVTEKPASDATGGSGILEPPLEA